MVFLHDHMAPQEDNTCFVKNNLWMPLWNGNEIHCAPAMPTRFLNAAGKCPHVQQAQRSV